MKNLLHALLIIAVLLSFNVAIPAAESDESESVFVSIAPLAHFVEAIAGDEVSVHVLVPPGESPATYSPRPRQMVELAKAKVLFRVGVPFENAFIPKIEKNMPQLKIIDLRDGIRLRQMDQAIEDDHAHEHEHEDVHEDDHAHDHKHEGDDPHIWLDPVNAKKISTTICKTLIELKPESKEQYTANLEKLHKELDALHGEIEQTLKQLKTRELLVFHPSYGYFCDRYNLRQIPVEVQGKEPRGKELARFIKLATDNNIRVIFVQPQFSDTAAQSIAKAIDGAVLPLDPLAKDYIENLRGMTVKIRKALEPESGKDTP